MKRKPPDEAPGPHYADTAAMVQAFVAVGASREKALTMALMALRVGRMFDPEQKRAG